MKIGIIGIGAIGGTLARKLCAAGHEVRVANSKGPEGVRAFAEEIHAIPADTQGAIDGADVVILSIPFPAVAKLPKGSFDSLPESVPVIDTGNYYPGMRDPHIPEIEAGKVESLWVAEQIGRPIIKDWNAEQTRIALTRAKPDAAPTKRDAMGETYATLGPNPSHAAIVASNRLINAVE
ncbi:NAD(P)-binding domain-containing protein [Lichenihabitans sp. PAMC28606]|uniref:NAD(P)-binding domain-containing protein n=1 Tax=Lichenihabitans sp. PAMC28606 TaxID=2880932 RepID=UPI001D0A54E9|nr:NAD(P)-binding domain-containing protein [Lichenihabitans sp. PAMC28606]UDL93093.1 NAD(P)-binding domain-containing protein [Lichenihabitans sp. PAMC28606]